MVHHRTALLPYLGCFGHVIKIKNVMKFDFQFLVKKGNTFYFDLKIFIEMYEKDKKKLKKKFIK